MIDKRKYVFCPIRNCGCSDTSCDGVLPVHTHEDCVEYADGEARVRLVCFKGDSLYELPTPYTQDELDRLIEVYEAKTIKPVAKESKHRKKPKRGRKGSGLKGKRTERMANQLADFRAWIRDNPIHERRQGCKVGERANQFWLQHIKTFEKDAKRDGEKRGFSSAKTLAAAYRNSK